MCLVVIKPRGSPMPKDKLLKRWFQDYPDGFGLAFQNADHVTILKGAVAQRQMFGIIRTMSKLLSARAVSAKDIDIIMHFRQATDGSISPKNCHPFPVTNELPKLEALTVDTPCALAHNGIIFDYSTYSYGTWASPAGDKTDTQMFIEEYLAYMGPALFNPAVQSMIAKHTSSKFALLTPDRYYTIGDFIQAKGYLFSNGGFRASPVTIVTGCGYSGSGYNYMDGYDTEIVNGVTYYKSRKPTASTLGIVASTEGFPPTPVEIIGHTCDLCEQVEEHLYYLPDDYDSHVCWQCFTNVMGYKPSPTFRLLEEEYLSDARHLGVCP